MFRTILLVTALFVLGILGLAQDGESANITLQPTPGFCPQSGGVILYKHMNFDCGGESDGYGYILRSEPGFQNVPGAFNDQASSLRVPSGWSVRLFQHDEGDGASICRSQDDSNFDGDDFDGDEIVHLNDQVSSFEVFSNDSCLSRENPVFLPVVSRQ